MRLTRDFGADNFALFLKTPDSELPRAARRSEASTELVPSLQQIQPPKSTIFSCKTLKNVLLSTGRQ